MSKQVSYRQKLLMPVCLGLAFFLGFEAGGFQLAVLSMANDFQVSSTGMGTIIASQYLAMTLGPFVMGGLSDRIGKKKVILAAAVLFAMGCMISALFSGLAFFVVGAAIVGVGYSGVESVMGAALADDDPEKTDRYMNLTQVSFSVGAVLSPVLLSAMMEGGADWRSGFLICGVAYLIIIPLLITAQFRANQEKEEPWIEKGKKHDMFGLHLFGRAGFLAMFLAILLYVGNEVSIAFFADSLFVLELGSTKLGAYAISVFWLTTGLIRLLFGFIKLETKKAILYCQMCLALGMAAIAISGSPWVSFVAFALAGVGAGPIWPLLVSMATRKYYEYSGAAAGLMGMGGSLGGALIPPVMGWFSDALGHRGAYGVMAALAMIAVILFYFGEDDAMLIQKAKEHE